MYLRLLSSCSIIFLTLQPVFSQIDKGFEALNKGQLAVASPYFEAELSNPDNKLLAQYGLLRVANLKEDFQSWIAVFSSYGDLYYDYVALDEKQKEAWEKSYGFTQNSLKLTHLSLYSKAFDFVETTNSCDTFSLLYKKGAMLPEAFQKEFYRWRKRCFGIASPFEEYGENRISAAEPLGTQQKFSYLHELNTPGNEYLPILSGDGETIYFVGSGRSDNLAQEDVFYSTKVDESTWAKPLLDTFFSGRNNEVILSSSVDGNQLILFEDGVISTSNRTQTAWTSPNPLKIPGNFVWIGPCSLNRNGQVLIFEARRTDLSEKIHLYVSLKNKNGEWGNPIKLGPNINTTSNDRSPFIHSDDKTLYFSSAQHTPNYGKLDVYKVTRLDHTWTKWSEPENLGEGVNTEEDDWGLFIPPNGRIAYMSTRSDLGADMDLVSFSLPEEARPEEQIIVKGSVQTVNGNKVPVKIMLEDVRTGIIFDSVYSSPAGDFVFAAPKSMKFNYYPKSKDVVAEKKVFVDPSIIKTHVLKSKATVISKEEALSKGLNLQSIQFEFGKNSLTEEGRHEVQRIYESIRDNNWKIRINGHTDALGSAQFNQALSTARAKEVRSYFIALGYPSDKIQSAGFGSSKPIASNDTEEGRASNRRVQIEVLKE
jgi:outer membrane protein OmpA-like peptidoglycan-associated protein